jgi:hypothetical protein
MVAAPMRAYHGLSPFALQMLANYTSGLPEDNQGSDPAGLPDPAAAALYDQ